MGLARGNGSIIHAPHVGFPCTNPKGFFAWGPRKRDLTLDPYNTPRDVCSVGPRKRGFNPRDPRNTLGGRHDTHQKSPLCFIHKEKSFT